MLELIENEIMDSGTPVQWHEIAGLKFVKTTVKEIVVFPLLRPDIFFGLRAPPKVSEVYLIISLPLRKNLKYCKFYQSFPTISYFCPLSKNLK